jgi:hypothetical protein
MFSWYHLFLVPMKVILVDCAFACGFALRGGQLRVRRLASGLTGSGHWVFPLPPPKGWLAQNRPSGLACPAGGSVWYLARDPPARGQQARPSQELRGLWRA